MHRIDLYHTLLLVYLCLQSNLIYWVINKMAVNVKSIFSNVLFPYLRHSTDFYSWWAQLIDLLIRLMAWCQQVTECTLVCCAVFFFLFGYFTLHWWKDSYAKCRWMHHINSKYNNFFFQCMIYQLNWIQCPILAPARYGMILFEWDS